MGINMNINIIDDSRDLLIKKDIEIKTLFYALKQSQVQNENLLLNLDMLLSFAIQICEESGRYTYDSPIEDVKLLLQLLKSPN